MGRAKNRPPGLGRKATEPGFSQRGHLRQHRRALLAADGQGAQLGAAHMRQHRLHRVEHQGDLTTEQICDGRCAAAVGDVLELNASGFCKQLSGQVAGRAIACRAELKAARLPLGRSHQLGNGRVAGGRTHHHRYGRAGSQSERREIFHRVIGQLFIQRRIDGVRADGPH